MSRMAPLGLALGLVLIAGAELKSAAASPWLETRLLQVAGTGGDQQLQMSKRVLIDYCKKNRNNCGGGVTPNTPKPPSCPTCQNQLIGRPGSGPAINPRLHHDTK